MIKVSDFNIVNAVENYGISVVTTDEDILDKLNKKFKIDQVSLRFVNVDIHLLSELFKISSSNFLLFSHIVTA